MLADVQKILDEVLDERDCNQQCSLVSTEPGRVVIRFGSEIRAGFYDTSKIDQVDAVKEAVLLSLCALGVIKPKPKPKRVSLESSKIIRAHCNNPRAAVTVALNRKKEGTLKPSDFLAVLDQLDPDIVIDALGIAL